MAQDTSGTTTAPQQEGPTPSPPNKKPVGEPGLKITVEVDTEHDSAEVVGEVLRGKFWKQPYKTYSYGTFRELGCYSSFDYQDDVEVLPEEIIERREEWDGKVWVEREKWQRARWNGVLCRWYWDGDGIIEFHFPDGGVLVNTDCKKTYGWE